MTLSPELELLLESAESEHKRWGGDEVGLLHFASVIERRYREQYFDAFDQSQRDAITLALRNGERVGDRQDLVSLLEEIGPHLNPAALVQRLRASLDDFLTGPETEMPESDGVGEDGLDLATGGRKSADTFDTRSSWAPQGQLAELVELVAPKTFTTAPRKVLDEIVSCLNRRTPVCPCVVGAPGSGKTIVIAGLAARLAESDCPGRVSGRKVVRLLPQSFLGPDRAARLVAVLGQLPFDVVLAVDDIEVLGGIGASSAYDGVVLSVLRGVVRSGRTLVLTIEASAVSRLEVIDPVLWARVRAIQLPALDGDLLELALAESAEQLAQHHQVTITEAALTGCLAPPSTTDGQVHPGLAIARLDAASARVALRDDRTVRREDLAAAGGRPYVHLAASELEDRLRQSIVGQDTAVSVVARRLALTRAELDLRPERPDGVFLFVGPTGVGKTELARAVNRTLYGSESALIRLDMSEYAEEWALSRLIGPQPGYVGYTEPESWLTTRIVTSPESVVLLDEIEKAHPTVWNAFLQVFDVGRLSDARGRTADFGRSVIIMTSNLGADALSHRPLGFNPGATADEARKLALRSVGDQMPPEFLGRLDDVVVFQPHSELTILDLARREVAALFEKLAVRGYELEIDEGALTYLAAADYDPQFGARHLQRSLERCLLEPLLESVPGQRLRAVVMENRIVWQATEG